MRRLENGLAESAPPRSVDRESSPLGLRANKRRVVNFLQVLGRRPKLHAPAAALGQRVERFCALQRLIFDYPLRLWAFSLFSAEGASVRDVSTPKHEVLSTQSDSKQLCRSRDGCENYLIAVPTRLRHLHTPAWIVTRMLFEFSERALDTRQTFG